MEKPKQKAPSKAKMVDVNYSQLSQELAELMAGLEQGDLGIDEAVRSYERGLAIVAQLESYLQTAENRVTELKNSLSRLDNDNADEEE